MYHIVECITSVKTKLVTMVEGDIKKARAVALKHAHKTGLRVEVQTEMGKLITVVHAR